MKIKFFLKILTWNRTCHGDNCLHHPCPAATDIYGRCRSGVDETAARPLACLALDAT